MSDSIANGGCCSGSVRPGTYGDANDVAQITVDKCGRITKILNVAITGGGGGGGSSTNNTGLLMNCSVTSTLTNPVSSNTFRIAMTSANGWTVNGVSNILSITAGGNFQVTTPGVYQVSLCLNTVSDMPCMFGIGSLATDGSPTTQ